MVHSQRLKKLTGALSCMYKGPKCIQFLWDHPKKIPFVQKQKEGAIRAIIRKKPILGSSQRLKKLTGALSCMHKGPKCIQFHWDHTKKIPFVQKHNEGAICAILRGKNPILGHSQRLRKVFLNAQGCARLRKCPIIMQIPRGYQKKKFIVKKVCDFVDKVGISVLRGVGWVPQKSADFGATAPAQKHPRSRCGTQKHSI